MEATENKLIVSEIKKYRRWVKLKGYTRDQYSLISYFNRKNKVKSIGGIYYITLGKRKYRFDEMERLFTKN
mgnify:CR=1 FL=1|jgi:hypothetical protein